MDVRLAGMIDTHTWFIFPLYCFAWSAAAINVGSQEEEIPDADHRHMKIPDVVYDVEFPIDQEYLGGS